MELTRSNNQERRDRSRNEYIALFIRMSAGFVFGTALLYTNAQNNLLVSQTLANIAAFIGFTATFVGVVITLVRSGHWPRRYIRIAYPVAIVYAIFVSAVCLVELGWV